MAEWLGAWLVALTVSQWAAPMVARTAVLKVALMVALTAGWTDLRTVVHSVGHWAYWLADKWVGKWT